MVPSSQGQGCSCCFASAWGVAGNGRSIRAADSGPAASEAHVRLKAGSARQLPQGKVESGSC